MAIAFTPRVRNVCMDAPTAGNPRFSVEVLTEVFDDATLLGEKCKVTVPVTLADFDKEQMEAYEAFKAVLLSVCMAKVAAQQAPE